MRMREYSCSFAFRATRTANTMTTNAESHIACQYVHHSLLPLFQITAAQDTTTKLNFLFLLGIYAHISSFQETDGPKYSHRRSYVLLNYYFNFQQDILHS
jgi:hypothetical protein